MPEFVLRSRLDHPVDKVFAWHMQPSAFERLLAPWARVRILKQTGTPATGGWIRLHVSWGPKNMTWEVKYTDFEDGASFRYEQTRGPFARWIHTHRFRPSGENGCTVEDHVEWELPTGVATEFFGTSTVERELERLFRFRHRRLGHDLGRIARYEGHRRLSVGVTGSTGLIGRALCQVLDTAGHRVVRLRRDSKALGPDDALWNPHGEVADTRNLEGTDAVVHLAGESLLSLRWTEEKKRRIWRSRVKGTEWLCRMLARLRRPPRVLVASSAVGYYGDRGNQVLTETSGPGKGFLAELCQAWEEATRPASRMGIRVVTLRTGLVLSPAGGALGTMLLPFKMGVGGRLGSGRQYVSWIDHDDMISLIMHVVRTDQVRGPVNAVTPYSVSNSTFAGTLGRVLRRPTVVPLPSLGVKALLGEMGTEMLLLSTRVRPDVAERTGFDFMYPGLEGSLRYQLGREMD